MNNDEILVWIINSIRENRSIDVLKVQDLIYRKQELELRNSSEFISVTTNAQKKKYETSLALSKLVLKTTDWIHSRDGAVWMKSQGLKWSNEDIGKNIFGWQKAFFYKLLKVAKLNDDVLVAFNEYCDNSGAGDKKINRTVENLLKFAKSQF
jgi:hypothetical protein